MDINQLIEVAKKASLDAGQAILEIYNKKDRGIELKPDDSPITQADKNANDIIMGYLTQTNIPVLSEEGTAVSYEERSQWDVFWMVDPLDGTKEFIKRNGEFTVNIALIEKGSPIAGVVYVPVSDELYWGNVITAESHYQKTGEEPIKLLPKSARNVKWRVVPGDKAVKEGEDENEVRILRSRSHMNAETLAFLTQFNATEELPMGSSLKFLKIVENIGDVYPRFGPTMEWDTAAAHAVMLACGYNIKNADTYEELVYNKEDLYNPNFMAF